MIKIISYTCDKCGRTLEASEEKPTIEQGTTRLLCPWCAKGICGERDERPCGGNVCR